jgi:AcrR family transcriptional regulator
MKQRPDAQKNRERLLAAAKLVFSEFGVTAPLELVRERANVGRATLYRNFPNRHALFLALVDEALDELDLHSDDFWDLLAEAAVKVVENEVSHAIWGAADIDSDQLAIRHKKLVGIFETPLAIAKQNKSVDPDITPSDIVLMLRMIGGAVHSGPTTERRQAAMRAVELLRRGISRFRTH